jgi:hypothetical protein
MKMCDAAAAGDPAQSLTLSLKYKIPNGRQTVMVLADSKSWVVAARMATPDIFWTKGGGSGFGPRAGLGLTGFRHGLRHGPRSLFTSLSSTLVHVPKQMLVHGLESVGSGVHAIGTVVTGAVGALSSVLKKARPADASAHESAKPVTET